MHGPELWAMLIIALFSYVPRIHRACSLSDEFHRLESMSFSIS